LLLVNPNYVGPTLQHRRAQHGKCARAGNVSAGGRGGPRIWPTVSPLVAKNVPTPGDRVKKTSFRPGQ